MRGHSGVVHPVAFSSNGRRVASGSLDHLVKIWNAETGAEVRRVHFVKLGFVF